MKNINSLVASVCFFLCLGIQPAISQVIIEGYAFESGNRGFLNEVFVEVYNAETQELISRSRSDIDGKFELTAPAGKQLLLKGSKDLFHDSEMEVSTVDKEAGEKAFVKLEMNRAPGYIFEITMAEKREDQQKVVDAIRGALVEVYNNTTREPILVLDDHPHPDFKIDLEKGNHYTIMIRKEGYLAKRMEAFVNVKGCILCFEGVGEVQPGVADNLTAGNAMGTLLANVELDKLFTGKKVTLNNIYYDYGKASIRSDAVEELQNAVTFLMDNPGITVELASHTDARGKADKNQVLSLKRAKNTVEWILENSELEKRRIVARGYGESSPINKCKDGVDCTEAEHAVNRRTEFKIMTISPQTEFKSLEKIKFEENMGDMIQELQNEGQIKVKDESELESVLKEKTEKVEEAKSVIKEPVTAKVDEKMEESKEMASTSMDEMVMDDHSNDMQESIDKKVDMEQSKEIVSTKMDQMAIDAHSNDMQESMDKKAEMAKAQSDDTKAMTEPAVMVNTIGNFTGYKYVVHFSGEALPDNHELFKTHDDLTVLQTSSSNYLYLIGDYASKVYAESGLKVIKKKYPEAYVIGFKNGERTE